MFIVNYFLQSVLSTSLTPSFTSAFLAFAVGPSSMPCQLMVGFFAYAKSLEINVDKDELEGIC